MPLGFLEPPLVRASLLPDALDSAPRRLVRGPLVLGRRCLALPCADVARLGSPLFYSFLLFCFPTVILVLKLSLISS